MDTSNEYTKTIASTMIRGAAALALITFGNWDFIRDTFKNLKGGKKKEEPATHSDEEYDALKEKLDNAEKRIGMYETLVRFQDMDIAELREQQNN